VRSCLVYNVHTHTHTHTHKVRCSPVLQLDMCCSQKRRLRNKLKTIAFAGVIYMCTYIYIFVYCVYFVEYIIYIYIYVWRQHIPTRCAKIHTYISSYERFMYESTWSITRLMCTYIYIYVYIHITIRSMLRWQTYCIYKIQIVFECDCCKWFRRKLA